MKKYIGIILAAAFIGWVYFPGALFHWNLAHDPYSVTNDAFQFLPSFDAYRANEPIKNEYIKNYYLNALMLPGYRAMYRFAAPHVDIHLFANALGYSLYGLFAFIMLLTTRKLGGSAAACIALVALLCGTPYLLSNSFLGGTSRMFAFPFLAFALMSLAWGRPLWLAAVTVIAAFFYPVSSAICGTTLALWLLALPRRHRGEASTWSLQKNILVLGISAILTALPLLPVIMDGKVYGERVLRSDVAEFPEAGVGGRYGFPGDALPHRLFDPQDFVMYLSQPFIGYGTPLIPQASVTRLPEVNAAALTLLLLFSIWTIIVRGTRKLVGESSAAGRILLLPAAGFLLHPIAYALAPYFYIPSRYFFYTLPLIALLLFPLALDILSRQFAPRYRTAAALLPVLLIMITMGGRSDVLPQWYYVVEPKDQILYQTIERLPPDALIAGWPGGMEMNLIPYVSHRNVLLNVKWHQAMYQDFMREMRRRMEAIMAAYFSKDTKALIALREQFGVTHFLVNRDYFTGDPPEYFEPWKDRIAPALAAAGPNPALLNPALLEKAGIFTHGPFVLLDLSKL